MDCHADKSARNDDKIESTPHINLKSAQDSKPTSAVGHSSTAIESSFSSEPCSEQALKASSGWGIVKGEGATSQFKPLPLNKKEKTESKEVFQALEVKAKDSETTDSESEMSEILGWCHCEILRKQNRGNSFFRISFCGLLRVARNDGI